MILNPLIITFTDFANYYEINKLNMKISITKILCITILINSFFINGIFAQNNVVAKINTSYLSVPEEYSLFTVSDKRRVFDLNGRWEVRLGKSSDWSNIDVPSSLDYKGIIHFRKSFFLSNDFKDFHGKLFATGLNIVSSIKINGVFVGSHAGGYTSFGFELLDSVLKPGQDNLIEIDIENFTDYSSPIFNRPTSWGWKNYSGIVREIYILFQPKVTVTSWKVDTELLNNFTNATSVFSFKFQNFNQSQGFDNNSAIKSENIQDIKYYIDIYNNNTGTLVKTTNSTPKSIIIHQTIEDTIVINLTNVDLWSPDNPTTYKFTLTLLDNANLKIDELSGRFGFKDIAINSNGFVLNGQNLKVNGIYRIEQHPKFGVSLDWDTQFNDLKLIKNLGLNAVRSGPYPNHPYFYDICDQLGIMVFEELPFSDVPYSELSKVEYIDQAKLLVNEMILRDRQHPSIVAWGIGSGINNDIKYDNFIKTISQEIKKIDSKPIYYSFTNINVNKIHDDVDFAMLDLFSPELVKFDKLLSSINIGNYDKPILIGRIGPNVLPGNLGGYQNKTSVNHQAKYITDIYNLLIEDSRLSGVFYWSFADWEGELPVLSSGNNNLNPFTYTRGLVSADRVERLSYKYLQGRINKSPMSSLTIGEEDFDTGKIIIYPGFVLIVLMLLILKQHRWFGTNFKRSLIFTKNFFEDVINKRNIQVWQTILLASSMSANAAIAISGICYYYKENVLFDYILSQFILSSSLKQVVIYLIWSPILNIIVLTFFIIALILIGSYLLHVVQLFFGISRGFIFSLNQLVWAGSHTLFTIPFSMAIFSAMNKDGAGIFYLILLTVLIAAYLYRYSIALKVAYKLKYKKAVTAFIILIFIFIGGTYSVFQVKYKSFTYVNHYINNIVQENN